ncbi:hypothetical protein BASA50_003800 [Batrachochytrium salamandrivorans]|uniref:Velvet domain-containing protein n=1 Tax=Batrachochytrium salamandrivorans TaxID=1357716 RepID=A0ABQ8FHH3_9FUNG|nr:hypothetical protein BASA50_003800 [Batrachochytrium salamandrivorans]KAH9257479.1 hypothetical protein BASA81_004241 [Batrachochytrium salamandrivorans]
MGRPEVHRVNGPAPSYGQCRISPPTAGEPLRPDEKQFPVQSWYRPSIASTALPASSPYERQPYHNSDRRVHSGDIQRRLSLGPYLAPSTNATGHGSWNPSTCGLGAGVGHTTRDNTSSTRQLQQVHASRLDSHSHASIQGPQRLYTQQQPPQHTQTLPGIASLIQSVETAAYKPKAVQREHLPNTRKTPPLLLADMTSSPSGPIDQSQQQYQHIIPFQQHKHQQQNQQKGQLQTPLLQISLPLEQHTQKSKGLQHQQQKSRLYDQPLLQQDGICRSTPLSTAYLASGHAATVTAPAASEQMSCIGVGAFGGNRTSGINSGGVNDETAVGLMMLPPTSALSKHDNYGKMQGMTELASPMQGESLERGKSHHRLYSRQLAELPSQPSSPHGSRVALYSSDSFLPLTSNMPPYPDNTSRNKRSAYAHIHRRQFPTQQPPKHPQYQQPPIHHGSLSFTNTAQAPLPQQYRRVEPRSMYSGHAVGSSSAGQSAYSDGYAHYSHSPHHAAAARLEHIVPVRSLPIAAQSTRPSPQPQVISQDYDPSYQHQQPQRNCANYQYSEGGGVSQHYVPTGSNSSHGSYTSSGSSTSMIRRHSKASAHSLDHSPPIGQQCSPKRTPQQQQPLEPTQKRTFMASPYMRSQTVRSSHRLPASSPTLATYSNHSHAPYIPLSRHLQPKSRQMYYYTDESVMGVPVQQSLPHH